MGVTYMKEPTSPLRVGRALQSRIRCTPFDFSRSMSPTNPSTPKCQPYVIDLMSRRDCETDGYYVRAQGSILKVPKSLFHEMMPEIRHSLLLSNGNGLSAGEAIQLSGLTPLQLRYLVHAFKEYPSLDLQKLPIDQLFSIAELACRFGLAKLKSWSIEAVIAVLNGPDSPLRSASNSIFIRALRIALIYGRADLTTSIQVKWLTRLHWKELSPIPAILIADKFELRNLLGHAYYTHLTEIECGVVEYCRRPTGSSCSGSPSSPSFSFSPSSPSSTSMSTSPLNSKQRTHLLAGFYSLSAYWKCLRTSPPTFPQSSRCKIHDQCLAAWRMRWMIASSSRPKAKLDSGSDSASVSFTPEYDVFKRLRFVEDFLKEDELLEVCLSPGCRTSALGAISKLRTHISNTLHHHFDLD